MLRTRSCENSICSVGSAVPSTHPTPRHEERPMTTTNFVAQATGLATFEAPVEEMQLDECWEIIHRIDDLVEALLYERCFALAAVIRSARITSPQRGPAGGYLPPCSAFLADVAPGLARFIMETRERRRRFYTRELSQLLANAQLTLRLADPVEARNEDAWPGDWLHGRAGRTRRVAA